MGRHGPKVVLLQGRRQGALFGRSCRSTPPPSCLLRLAQKENALLTWVRAAQKDGRLKPADPLPVVQQMESLVKGSAFWPQVTMGQTRLGNQAQKQLASDTGTAALLLRRYAVQGPRSRQAPLAPCFRGSHTPPAPWPCPTENGESMLKRILANLACRAWMPSLRAVDCARQASIRPWCARNTVVAGPRQ